MSEPAILAAPRRAPSLGDAGIALCVVLAVPFAMFVEWFGYLLVERSVGFDEWAAFSVFAVPLVTVWWAIALTLSARQLWLRLGVAALLLLVPPIILFGVLNG